MIGNASFAVDTFFFLSGLLVSLLFLRKGERASRQKSVFTFMGKSSVKASLLIIYRYLRLTPVYLVAIVANELSLKYTYNQSVFSPSIYDHVTCHHYWWRNILYINNWYPFQELCMIWSWYLANDMQFYLMAIFLLILSTRWVVRWRGEEWGLITPTYLLQIQKNFRGPCGLHLILVDCGIGRDILEIRIHV